MDVYMDLHIMDLYSVFSANFVSRRYFYAIQPVYEYFCH